MRSLSSMLLLISSCILLLTTFTTVHANSGPNLVSSLPGISPGEELDTMYTGYLDIFDAYNSSIFYWLAEARNPAAVPSETPVVLWLQGGPGCSGGLGWFYENGPYNLQANQSLTVNPYSWNTNAHFLFVDQPIGSGLSTIPPEAANATDVYPTTIEQQTAQLYTALQQFFELHFPSFAQNPFYITGESYAGKYIPNLSTMILDGQEEFPLNLVSIAIGDGWVDPLPQTQVYGEQAYQLGLIDENEKAYVDAQYQNCSALTAAEDWHDAQVVCDGLLNWIVAAAGNINVDDVREFGDDEHDDRLEVYLSNPAVWSALTLVNPPSAYQSCSAAAGAALSLDEMKPSVQLLPNLVDKLQMVYLYEGNFDMNCGVTGVERYLATLFPAQYSQAVKSLWIDPVTGGVSGSIRPLMQNLMFIVVQDAGHMVPKTQPRASADMLNHLLTNTPFKTASPQNPPMMKSVAKKKIARSSSSSSTSTPSSSSLRLPHFHHVYSRRGHVYPTSVARPRKSDVTTTTHAVVESEVNEREKRQQQRMVGVQKKKLGVQVEKIDLKHVEVAME